MFVLNGWMAAVLCPAANEHISGGYGSGRETAEAFFLSRPFVLLPLFPPTFFVFSFLSVVAGVFVFFAVSGTAQALERATGGRVRGAPHRVRRGDLGRRYCFIYEQKYAEFFPPPALD